MRRFDLVLIAALFVFALLLRVAIVASTGFDGLYGQDPFAYYDFSAALAQGNAPAVFFWPLGYPSLMAAGFWLFGISAATAQGISLLLGALLSPLSYILARQMRGERWGALIAGVLMAVCGQALQSSIVIMADIPALAWVTLSAACLWRYLQINDATRTPLRTRVVWLILSAVTLALAIITRWLCLIFVPVWGIIYLSSLTWRGGVVAVLRARWREMVAALIVTLLVFIPQILYSRTNPYPTLNHAWVEGWSPANIFQHDFSNFDGNFSYPTINALYYAQVYTHPYYLSPVWTPFLLLGLAALAFKRRWRALFFLLGWGMLPYLFLAGIPYQNIRFPLIVFPAVAVVAGLGMDELFTVVKGISASIAQRRRTAPTPTAPREAELDGARRRGFARWGFVALQLIVIGGLLIASLRQTYLVNRATLNDFIANQQLDRDSVTWAAAQIPEGARIYSLGITLTLEHYTDFEVIELYNETPATLRQRWIPGEDDYLLVSVWNLRNQWQGRGPDIAVRWLSRTRGLVRIASNERYTLYRVQG